MSFNEFGASYDNIGTGFRFPFKFNTLGRVQESRPRKLSTISDNDNKAVLTKSITQLFGTSVGERYFNRDIGSDFFDSLFEPASSTTIEMINSESIDVITTYETRVNRPIVTSNIDAANGKISFLVVFSQRTMVDQVGLPITVPIPQGVE